MLMTLEDQLTVIRSHLASVERQKHKEDWEALAVFLEGIATASSGAAEYCRAKYELTKDEKGTGGTP